MPREWARGWKGEGSVGEQERGRGGVSEGAFNLRERACCRHTYALSLVPPFPHV